MTADLKVGLYENETGDGRLKVGLYEIACTGLEREPARTCPKSVA